MALFSPKTRRNIERIIPFGVIWWLMGLVFILVETAAMGTLDPDSPVIISLTGPVIVFVNITVIIVGLIVGCVEILVLENVFRYTSYVMKFVYKLIIYSAILFILITLAYPIAASLETGYSYFSNEVRNQYLEFIQSVTFMSTGLQMAASTLVCLIYSNISENVGHAVMVNYLRGRYHKPKEEQRIFMFTDMKSSTSVAEQLGHIRYFDLLREYYADLSDAIINHLGEVYQYIGDEIVITWTKDKGLKDNNCIETFFDMQMDLNRKSDYYITKYGVVPTFKAGVHIGSVTTGEIGALKKEIAFTGDVLNVTARLQGLCNEYNSELLISGDLLELMNSSHYQLIDFGMISIKGRAEPMNVFAISKHHQPDPGNKEN